MKRYLGLGLLVLFLVTGCEIEVRRIVIDVTPESVTLAPGETQVFTATTTSENATDFSWRADGGSFSSAVGETVTYTAPESEGVYEVTARPTNGGNDLVEGSATVTVSLTKDLTPVTANALPNTPVSGAVTLGADEIVVFEITVPRSVAQSGDLLFVELSEDLELSVYDGDKALYASSSSANYFAAGSGGFSVSGAEPQSISNAANCRGSCAAELIGADAATLYAKVKNSSGSQATFDLYVFVRAFSDATEPDNDRTGDAPSFSSDESGAIETLGDEDYFRVGAAGSLTFIPFPAAVIDLRAEIVDALGSKIADAPANRAVQVQAGDFVKVYVPSGDEAAAASKSGYSLTIE